MVERIEIEINRSGLGKKYVDFNYLADLMEREDLKKRLISQIHELENKLGLAKLDSLLTEYEIIDLELKIIDLKIKLLDQGHTEN